MIPMIPVDLAPVEQSLFALVRTLDRLCEGHGPACVCQLCQADGLVTDAWVQVRGLNLTNTEGANDGNRICR